MTCLACSAWTALAMARYVLPVPAGPMPKTIVCCVDRVDVALLAQRLGPDGAPAPGQDVERQHLGRALGGALLEHADGAADGVRGQRLALLDQLEQLGEDPLGLGVVGRARRRW